MPDLTTGVAEVFEAQRRVLHFTMQSDQRVSLARYALAQARAARLDQRWRDARFYRGLAATYRREAGVLSGRADLERLGIRTRFIADADVVRLAALVNEAERTRQEVRASWT